MRPLEALKERIADERRRDKSSEMPKPLDLLRERNRQLKSRTRRNALLTRTKFGDPHCRREMRWGTRRHAWQPHSSGLAQL